MILIAFAAIALVLFLFLKHKKIDTKFSLIGAVAVFIILTSLPYGLSSKEDPPLPEVVVEKDFGVTPEQFRNNFNEIMAQLNMPNRISISDIELIERDAVDLGSRYLPATSMFMISRLTKATGMYGYINRETGNVKNVCIIAVDPAISPWLDTEGRYKDRSQIDLSDFDIIATAIDKALGGAEKDKTFFSEGYTSSFELAKVAELEIVIKSDGNHNYKWTFDPGMRASVNIKAE